MHHHVRVTDEQDGRRTHDGRYVIAGYEIVVSVNWTGGHPAEVAAALEAATSSALRQINATNKDTE